MAGVIKIDCDPKDLSCLEEAQKGGQFVSKAGLKPQGPEFVVAAAPSASAGNPSVQPSASRFGCAEAAGAPLRRSWKEGLWKEAVGVVRQKWSKLVERGVLEKTDPQDFENPCSHASALAEIAFEVGWQDSEDSSNRLVLFSSGQVAPVELEVKEVPPIPHNLLIGLRSKLSAFPIDRPVELW